jgi:hypothetical protein
VAIDDKEVLWTAIANDVRPISDKRCRELAAQLLPPEKSSQFNQWMDRYGAAFLAKVNG